MSLRGASWEHYHPSYWQQLPYTKLELSLISSWIKLHPKHKTWWPTSVPSCCPHLELPHAHAGGDLEPLVLAWLPRAPHLLAGPAWYQLAVIDTVRQPLEKLGQAVLFMLLYLPLCSLRGVEMRCFYSMYSKTNSISAAGTEQLLLTASDLRCKRTKLQKLTEYSCIFL